MAKTLKNWQICARPYLDGSVGGLPVFNWHELEVGGTYRPKEPCYVFYSDYGQRNWKGTKNIVFVRRLDGGLQVFLEGGEECFLASDQEKK